MGLADARECLVGKERVALLIAQAAVALHRGIHRARHQRVYPDAVLAELQRRHLGQPTDGELRGAVRSHAVHPGHPVDGRHVDNGPAPTPPA